MSREAMKLTLNIWRQADSESDGRMHTYQLDDVSPDMSFLEMLDVLNEDLNAADEEPIAFDSDCREGICGMCSLMINGEPHGPEVTTTCQLHMRSFSDGDTIRQRPSRAPAIVVVSDRVRLAGRMPRCFMSSLNEVMVSSCAIFASRTNVPLPRRRSR